jgi:hypothetical protein
MEELELLYHYMAETSFTLSDDIERQQLYQTESWLSQRSTLVFKKHMKKSAMRSLLESIRT